MIVSAYFVLVLAAIICCLLASFNVPSKVGLFSLGVALFFIAVLFTHT